MGKPRARRGVIEVTLFGQHEGVSARLGSFEIAAGDFRLGSLHQLLPRRAAEDPLGALQELRQLGAHGWRVVTIRRAYSGVPETWIIETGCPGAFDEADEAVLTFHRRFVAVAAE